MSTYFSLAQALAAAADACQLYRPVTLMPMPSLSGAEFLQAWAPDISIDANTIISTIICSVIIIISSSSISSISSSILIIAELERR